MEEERQVAIALHVSSSEANAYLMSLMMMSMTNVMSIITVMSMNNSEVGSTSLGLRMQL